MEIPLKISLADTSHFLRCSSKEPFQETPKTSKENKRILIFPLQFHNTLHYNTMLATIQNKKEKRKGKRKE